MTLDRDELLRVATQLLISGFDAHVSTDRYTDAVAGARKLYAAVDAECPPSEPAVTPSKRQVFVRGKAARTCVCDTQGHAQGAGTHTSLRAEGPGDTMTRILYVECNPQGEPWTDVEGLGLFRLQPATDWLPYVPAAVLEGKTDEIRELLSTTYNLEFARDAAIARAEAAERERDAAIERCSSPEAYRLYQEETSALLHELRRRAQTAEAAARVLAHAWDHDSNPPDWAVEAGRSYPL